MATHELSELSTGELVISERVPGVRSVALGFWIGAGSRDEPDTRAGVSHFIEHLLFKGSSRYSAQDIAEIFDELGGRDPSRYSVSACSATGGPCAWTSPSTSPSLYATATAAARL